MVHVLTEGHGPLVHLPGHRLGTHVVALHPGMVLAEDPERAVEELPQRLGVLHLGEALHPLLVRHALGLQLAQKFHPQALCLRGQHHAGVLQHRLQHRQHIEVVVGLVGVEHAERLHGEQRQRLVQGEAVLQVDRDAHPPVQFVGGGEQLHHPGLQQRPVDADRPADVATLAAARLVVLHQQAPQGRAAVAGPVQHVHHHLVAHGEAGRQGLRLGGHQPVERVGVPVGVVALRRFALDHLALAAGVGGRLLCGDAVLDPVGRGLHPHESLLVVTGPPRPTGDLMELPGAQEPGLLPVVLAELREQHRADRYVDTHAEGVGAADQLQ